MFRNRQMAKERLPVQAADAEYHRFQFNDNVLIAASVQLNKDD